MKNKLFKKIAASVLSLALLLPCVMTAPVVAAGEAPTQLYQWLPAGVAEDSAAISTNLFGESSNNYMSGSHIMYTENGPVLVPHFRMLNSTASDKSYGLPYETVTGAKNTKTRTTENLKLVLEKMPAIETKDKEAVNLILNFEFLPYTHTTNPAFTRMMRVYVSVDGTNYLEDYAGVRYVKMLGAGNASSDGTSANDAFFYEMQSENLLDIEGLKKGDTIKKIMIMPDGEYADTYQSAYFNGITINGYSTVKAFEAAVPEMETMKLDPQLVRDIVIGEGVKTATLPWKTENTIWTVNSGGIGKDEGQQYYPEYTYRGGVYERETDINRENLQHQIVDGMLQGGYTNQTAYGMDCANFVFNAVSRATRSYAWACQGTYQDGARTTLVGDHLKRDDRIYWTDYHVLYQNTDQDIYLAYTQANPGDIFLSYGIDGGGHTRILVKQEVVYNQDGTIDPAKSIAYFTEQASNVRYDILKPDGTVYRLVAYNGAVDLDAYLKRNPGSTVLYGYSAGADLAWTYKQLYDGYYVPFTLQEYQDGILDVGKTDIFVTGRTGSNILTDGIVIGMGANYVLRYCDITLEDVGQEKTLYDVKHFFPTPRMSATTYQSDDLDTLLANLTNGTYRLTVDVAAGPVTEVGGEVPITTKVVEFTVKDKAPATKVELKAPASAAKGDKVTVTVDVSAAVDTADIEVKFDASVLDFQEGSVTPDAKFKIVKQENGVVRIACVQAGASAGQLATLTFTAKSDIAKASDVVSLKSAMVSTADLASVTDIAKAIG